MKPTKLSLANELNIGAVAALDEAREMPPGEGRTKAMRKARILRNAAEIHEHFFGKSGAPGKWKAAQRYSPPDPPFTHHD